MRTRNLLSVGKVYQQAGRLLLLAAIAAGSHGAAATFGTRVVTNGHIADIALDERRGLLYMANLGGNRIDVMSTSTLQLQEPLRLTIAPASVALSKDGRYLAVAHLTTGDDGSTPSDFSPLNRSRVTVFDLDAHNRRVTAIIPGHSLAIAFGNSPKAMMLTSSGFYRIDPVTAVIERITATPAAGDTVYGQCKVPVFPTLNVHATAAVSGDGNVIRFLSRAEKDSTSTPDCPDYEDEDVSLLTRYDVRTGRLDFVVLSASPTLGPGTITMNRTGDDVLAGWGLFRNRRTYPGGIWTNKYTLLAQFPRATGEHSYGGFAFDDSRHLIFGDVPDTVFAPMDDGFGIELGMPTGIMHVFAPDNLTVIERLHIPEGLSGKAVFSSDRNTLYAISESGVTVFPMGEYGTAARVKAKQESVLFKGNGCERSTLAGYIDVVDPNGGAVDFELTVPSDAEGITFSPSSGTTPARVRVEVSPTVFQERKGTTVIPVTVSSSKAINIPLPVKLLINTRDPEQRGTITEIPGTIVDMLADPQRDRAYLLRQDTNEVLVYDTVQEKVVSRFRTGNTPVGMAITPDGRRLLVGNDNSSLINMYSLEGIWVGQPVQTIAPAALYSEPSSSSAIVGSAFVGATGTVVQGPQEIDGTKWWKVTVDDGASGWTPDRFLSVVFPPLEAPLGYYPRTVAAVQGATWATARTASGDPEGVLLRADMGETDLFPPSHLGPYVNDISKDSVVAASPDGDVMLVASPDGRVIRYEPFYDGFSAGRMDYSSFKGAYGALSGGMFAVGTELLNGSLVPIGRLDGDGTPSGFAMMGGHGVLASSTDMQSAGTIRKIDLTDLTTIAPTDIAEAPSVSASLASPPIGQIGQTILPFTRTVAVLRDGASVLVQTVSGLTRLPSNFDDPIPAPELDDIVNMADGSSAVAPGGLVRFTGQRLTDTPEGAGAAPLPTSLGGVCARINNVPVPMFSVSSGEIRAQIPQGVSGQSTMVLRTVGGSATMSFEVSDSAPAIFRGGTAGDLRALPTIFRAANDQLVTGTNPVRVNDVLTVFVTGLGRTSPAVGDGEEASSDPLPFANVVPTVTLGGVPLGVEYAGLTPGAIGVGQLNVRVPSAIPQGVQVPLTIKVGSYETTVNVRVVKP